LFKKIRGMARHAHENNTALSHSFASAEFAPKPSPFRGKLSCYYFFVRPSSHAGFSSSVGYVFARTAFASGMFFLLVVAGQASARTYLQGVVSESQGFSFETLSKSATAAREAGHLQKAIEYYRRAVQLRPDWTEGWWYLGTMSYDANRFADAIAFFQKAVVLAPNLSDAWTFLGLCEFAQKDYENARQHLQKGKALGPSGDLDLDRVAHFHLALLQIRNGAFTGGARLIASDFSKAEIPTQAQFALGLAMLRIPLVPEEVAPSKEAIIQEAGHLAAQSFATATENFADVFPALLAKHPNAPYLHYAYGQYLAEDSREQEATVAFRKEAELSPNSELAKTSPEIIPRDASALQRINAEVAAYYSDSGSPSATDLTAGDPWGLALQDFALHKYSDAVRHLTAVVKAQPGSGTAWAMLGLSEFELKQYDNARIHLQKGQDLGWGGSVDSVRDARYHLALLLIRDGEFERATSFLVSDSDKDAATLRQEIRFALGMALLRLPHLPQEIPAQDHALVERAGEISSLLYESKYDLAFPKLKSLIAEHPATHFLHYAYGTALSSLSQFPEAQKQLVEETRISPGSDLPYLSLASIDLKLKQPENALPFAQRALTLAPQSPEPHYYLGRCYLELDKPQDAITELVAAARLLPGSPDVHFQLARAYAKTKQNEKATQERETFQQLNALAEKQRGRLGSQAYGAAGSDHSNSGISRPQSESNSPH